MKPTGIHARLLFISMLVCGACDSALPVEPRQNYQSKLVIEGILYPGQATKIYVSKSLPFFDDRVTPQEVFARGASVTLSDDTGSEILKADSTFDKFRCRWVPFYKADKISELGKTYDLQVTFDGKTYHTSTTIKQSPVKVNSVDYIADFHDVYGGHDGVRINISDVPGQENFYRFLMTREIDRSVKHAHILDVIEKTCTEPEEKFEVSDYGRTIFDDKGNDGRNLELLVEVSFEYSKGDSAWVFIQSMDPKSAAFYRDLDDQLVSIFNPFVEPVFIKSSIDGGALGVFGSAVLSDSVLFIYPQDTP